MFLHLYLYRLKCIIRDKQNVFWTLMFPLILATFFHLALSNISNMESFTEIKIGIIDNEELREHKEFTEIIESVPDLFNVYVSGQMLTSLGRRYNRRLYSF